MQQVKFQFDKVTLKKMGKSALLLVAGVLLDFILNNLLTLITGFGIPMEYRPLTVSALTWLINTGKEWVEGEKSAIM